MKWSTLLLLAALVVIIFLLQKSSLISPQDARDQLKRGALVIDVREPGEFNTSHLPGAINIPLDELESVVPQRIPDKARGLLVHCQSGMRSAIAKRKLRGMGYLNASNLGSLSRAKEIIEHADDP